jgi:hypothetical protein
LSRRSAFLDALDEPGPLHAVELRPPRSGLDPSRSLDAWIESHHGLKRLLDQGRYVLYTDDAVGDREEESLRLLTTSLGPTADLSKVLPFLTLKHPLEYCLLFARRAASYGLGAVTVTGGDVEVGPPRCLPRSRDLRELIRQGTPGLPLGTWVNPYRDPEEQVGFLVDQEAYADYFLTQVVSHHGLDRVDGLLEAASAKGLSLPGLFGVFYYRSGTPETLRRLARFFPVPVEELLTEFEAGVPPDEVCARTIRGLRSRGVEKVYLCNLGDRRPADVLRSIEERL